jgi:gamma-glutamylcyclotransferase (GGCT)/AIG2-like uncharacterized protein YtfP
MIMLIFVYGTLMRGERLSRVLEDSVFIGEDETKPTWQLIDLGSFPGMIPGETSIKGELYLVDQNTKNLLDKIEGHPYLYRRTPLILKSGKIAEAYMFLSSADNCPIIKSGSWKEYTNHESYLP